MLYIKAEVYARFTLPRPLAEITLSRMLTDAEVFNQLVSWAAGVEARLLEPLSLAISQ